MPRLITVARISELEPGRGTAAEAGGLRLALFEVDGEIRAYENRCPHQGAPLSDGLATRGLIICPLHAWGFDAGTGKCTHDPLVRISRYPVTVEGDEIKVEVP